MFIHAIVKWGDIMSKAKWIPVYGYEGLYEINASAEIRTVERYTISKRGIPMHIKQKIMKPYVNDNGYLVVRLTRNKRSKVEKVHRLLMLSFVGPDPERPIVNHKNGKKLDLDLSNLEWTTSSENNKHAYAYGLKKNKTRPIRCTIDSLVITSDKAIDISKRLHNAGLFCDVSEISLATTIRDCANKHSLYKGIMKCEFLDDEYDVPNRWHKSGSKGNVIYARMPVSGLTLKARGPSKLVRKLQRFGYLADGNFDTMVKSISDAAHRSSSYRGIKVWYE